MKSRVLGLACAAGLAAGCQSPGSQALSRWKATQSEGKEIAQTSHETSAGLPGASKRRTAAGPSSPEDHFQAGEKSLQQFYRDTKDKPIHLQRARTSFEAAAKADPTFADAQHRLAIVADLQERYRESESYYRTALSLNPDNPNIAADLGWSYILQERWTDAERALNRALELDPNSRVARDHLARCHQQLASPQMGGSHPGPRGEMMANQPASVAGGREMGMPPRDGRAAPQMNGGGPPQYANQFNEGEYLRQQLSDIDHAGEPPAGQPWNLDPRRTDQSLARGPVNPSSQPAPALQQQYSPPQNSSPQMLSGQQELRQPQESRPTFEPQQQPVGGPNYAGGQPQQNGQQHFRQYGPAADAQRSAPLVANQQGRPQTGREMSGNGFQGNAYGRQQATNQEHANGGGIQRTQSLDPPTRPDAAVYSQELPLLPGQSGYDQSGHDRGNWPQVNSQQQPTNGQSAPSTAPPTGYGSPAPQPQVNGPAQGRSPLEQARRDAAMMGLGLGPGQLFPTLEHQTQRMSPGSNSQMNGAAFPTPQIQSPDLRPPMDLRQNPSFFQEQSMTPPPNSMGQTMPSGTSSTMTPGTWNDPNARFQQNQVAPTAGQLPLPPLPPQNFWTNAETQAGMQGYDDTRRATDQQLQQTLSNTWANTPSNAIPSPSSGVSMERPGQPSQMMTDAWSRQPVAPEPYPQAGPRSFTRPIEVLTLPAVNPSPSRTPASNANPYPTAGRTTAPVYRNGVVVPEQYGSPRY